MTSDIIKNVEAIIKMHQQGLLGGDVMPEDARPDCIDIASADNFHFLTLPMALNYQRNSYKLWEGAAQTYLDPTTQDVFNPKAVVQMSTEDLRQKLLKYKVALQPNKHIEIWQKVAQSICMLCEGDVRTLFNICKNDVLHLKNFCQKEHKKGFPYLSGDKIFNYWLYVMQDYTPLELLNKQAISIAPDTHVIQATARLGLIPNTAVDRKKVADLWYDLLEDSPYVPIDIHTSLWLWSRAGFPTYQHK